MLPYLQLMQQLLRLVVQQLSLPAGLAAVTPFEGWRWSSEGQHLLRPRWQQQRTV